MIALSDFEVLPINSPELAKLQAETGFAIEACWGVPSFKLNVNRINSLEEWSTRDLESSGLAIIS